MWSVSIKDTVAVINRPTNCHAGYDTAQDTIPSFLFIPTWLVACFINCTAYHLVRVFVCLSLSVASGTVYVSHCGFPSFAGSIVRPLSRVVRVGMRNGVDGGSLTSLCLGLSVPGALCHASENNCKGLERAARPRREGALLSHAVYPLQFPMAISKAVQHIFPCLSAYICGYSSVVHMSVNVRVLCVLHIM